MTIDQATGLHPESFRPVDRPLRRGPWRDQVRARAGWLRSQARWLELDEPARATAFGTAIEEEIFRPLDRVDHIAATEKGTPGAWLSGSYIEECWRLLRQAEEGLVRAVDDAHLPGVAAACLDDHARHPGGRHPLVLAARAQIDTSTADVGALRRATLEALHASHEDSDEQHRSARSFRNQLLGVSMVMVALAAIALLVQATLQTRLLPAVPGAAISPIGGLALAMFFGCVGALFSAIPSLAQIPKSTSPFNLPRQQAVLKVVTGAWAAVIGLEVLDAGLAGDRPALSSLGGLAILALLFGAGQEAVTRFADHAASNILGSP